MFWGLDLWNSLLLYCTNIYVHEMMLKGTTLSSGIHHFGQGMDFQHHLKFKASFCAKMALK